MLNKDLTFRIKIKKYKRRFNDVRCSTYKQRFNHDFPSFFFVTTSQNTVEVFLHPHGYHISGGGCIKVNYIKDNITYQSVLAVNPTQVEYQVMKRETTIKDEVLATQSYVKNMIQGAITASY